MNWVGFQKEIIDLSKKIDYSPDILVGIVRGGIVPARILSSLLKVGDMYCLTVKKIGNNRRITSIINEDINNKKVLLVEDILETGRSLITAKQYLENEGAIVKTACLYITNKSEIKPDYYLRKINEVVKFPWEYES
ncbi:phosphoribosyltransferase domain-containing protein [Candidatus Gottesmanbacteria bacterium]|nr:phosphoribosyltransferase domain-containing protein [Candidatus Gottesmanbacteria bacterium]